MKWIWLVVKWKKKYPVLVETLHRNRHYVPSFLSKNRCLKTDTYVKLERLQIFLQSNAERGVVFFLMQTTLISCTTLLPFKTFKHIAILFRIRRLYHSQGQMLIYSQLDFNQCHCSVRINISDHGFYFIPWRKHEGGKFHLSWIL